MLLKICNTLDDFRIATKTTGVLTGMSKEHSPPADAPSCTQADGDSSLWTADDVASYLKVSRSWVYHRAESGSLPHARVGGLLRFQPADIRAFVGSTTSEPPRTTSLESSHRPSRRPPRG